MQQQLPMIPLQTETLMMTACNAQRAFHTALGIHIEEKTCTAELVEHGARSWVQFPGTHKHKTTLNSL